MPDKTAALPNLKKLYRHSVTLEEHLKKGRRHPGFKWMMYTMAKRARKQLRVQKR